MKKIILSLAISLVASMCLTAQNTSNITSIGIGNQSLETVT